MGDRTSFVVAQRISTVLNGDKIIVLDKGRVAAEGTHAELLRTSPIYQEIYDSQLGGGLPKELAADSSSEPDIAAPLVPHALAVSAVDGISR